ncbi:hypothetical protein [Lentzea flaviverrucosa]|uniref:Uncharacterized protein n=1 Tax=Lentzea flaviverrucosa TaxID=200379 RepID=A0A1H9MHN5_9PSEU|nr:hypothetical protein [Lentzea flaviverrucosa]RDI30922.1 hypothetical protein DFR72_104255 [Lentzea flaviverrucosa]SER22967.1 hypothetical protein SAMN05216195_104372 [Lentzea flaviverrucosa]
MSFSSDTRKVLDDSLPLGRRVTALCYCLERYSPIGFHASLSFLRFVAGDFTRDPAALPRAMELLTSSYTAWQAELRAYAVLRRHAKRLGYRRPHPSAPNPNQPSHWYGAPREGALHAVWVWYSKGDSADVDVHSLAVALLERGRFTAEQREIFDRVCAQPGNSRAIVRQMAVVVAKS